MTEAEKLLATLDVNDPKLLPIPSKDDGYIIMMLGSKASL